MRTLYYLPLSSTHIITHVIKTFLGLTMGLQRLSTLSHMTKNRNLGVEGLA